MAGIVDSGADTSAFPFGFAALMGYTRETLETQTFAQAGGTGNAFRAKQPCIAQVPELPGITMELRPSFIVGAQMVLWGRNDFMTYFDVTFQQRDEKFILTPR